MPAIGLVGRSIVGTGIDVGPGSPTVMCEGSPVSLIGDKVTPHGKPPHTAAIIITGSQTVLIDGRPPAVQGLSVATCAHVVVTGAFTVDIT